MVELYNKVTIGYNPSRRASGRLPARAPTPNLMSDGAAGGPGVRDAQEEAGAEFAKQQAALEAKKARRGAQKA